ncbi:sugar phosphate isomerase/epimerase family protein [Bauldia sp.]|uniref:sugar phosphate isomerase/epimerase family protein n=1 Tax=Bauldia sp. TaxID=2575872 RepID=UPI003BACFA3E
MTDPTANLALSTWSLHRTLGISYPDSPDNPGRGQPEPTWGEGTISLMDLPAEIARRGIHRLEICTFHMPRHDRGFHTELRAALDEAGVTFQTLLIDDGDITHPDYHDRDMDWIEDWIEIATVLGAEKARVIAGKQTPTPEVLERSINGLKELGRFGAGHGVRVITENWLATTPGPTEVNAIMDAVGDQVGLLADFGNWSGTSKYDDLAAIMVRAENTHAKCAFSDDGEMNADDFGRCLAVASEAGFNGPHTLIYESADNDEWGAIERERDFVRNHLRGTVH